MTPNMHAHTQRPGSGKKFATKTCNWTSLASRAGKMTAATALAGSVVCCSCLGMGALVRWRYESQRRSAQKQRYLPVRSMEEDFDDDDDDVLGDDDTGEDVCSTQLCPL